MGSLKNRYAFLNNLSIVGLVLGSLSLAVSAELTYQDLMILHKFDLNKDFSTATASFNHYHSKP